MKNFLLTIAFLSLFFSSSLLAEANNSLDFDGTNDFVSIPASTDWAIGTGDFTVEWWQYQTDANMYPRIFAVNGNTFGVSIENYFGTYKIFCWLGVSNTSVEAGIYKNQWVHFAVTRSGGTVSFYKNGSYLGGGTNNGNINSSIEPLILGKKSSVNEYYGGKLDEFRIWNVARTETEINNNINIALAGNEAGLVAYYKFDQGTPGGDNTGLTNLVDNTIASSHNGTLTNFALTGSTSNWVEGNNNLALPVGAGTVGDPYQIATLANLYWISQNSAEWDKYYIQTADIDASSTSTWNSNTGWSPIGNTITKFIGTYNGNTKTISGLYINRVANNQGFFGSTNGGSISNLGLMSININAGGGNTAGGLASFTESTTISNCYSTGTIIGNQYIGGLIGNHYLGSVSSSFSSCNVTGSSACGGLIGLVSGNVQNCYSTGNVTRKTGGLNTDLGGFAGWSNGSHTITKCYSTGRVIYTNATDPTDKGFLGRYFSGTLTGNFWDTQTSMQATTAGTATGKTTLEMKTQSTFTDAGWDFLGEIVNGVNDYWNTSGGRNDGYPFLTWQTLAAPSGSGTIGAPYQIATLENLYWISASNTDVPNPNQATRWAVHYIQNGDIDASSTSTWNAGAGWVPMGNNATKFTGTYDGNWKIISGIYINRPSGEYQGLFGYINGGTVSNLGVINLDVNVGGLYEGGLVGAIGVGTTITTCYSTGNLNGNVGTTNIIGGLVGSSYGDVINCYSTASVTGWVSVGGLVGANSGNIFNSYARGSVTGDQRVGGLVGMSYGAGAATSYCYSTGSATGNIVGGLVGTILGGTVSNSFWDTQTSANSSSDGGIGKTTAQMKTQSTFTGWDIDIWNMDAGYNSGYPYLKWQNPSGTPLPVELTSFSATTVGSKVNLSWSTATEVNNYGFEIERKILNQVQNDTWNKIGFVNGSGNSSSPKDYSFVDDRVIAGKYSYRLKQIDNDGQFEYSKTIEVDINGVKEYELSQNYPNPFNPTTTIQYGLLQTGMVRLTLYNILGQEIRTLVNEVREAGTHVINLNASDLNSGVYIYKIESGSFTQTRKMTLIK